MPYSEKSDLLIGDLFISERFDQGKFVQEAGDEINAKLGWLYELPLHLPWSVTNPEVDPIPDDSWTLLPEHQKLLLKGINNKLASGRLILTLSIPGEETTLHAYGYSLVREAQSELMVLANGEYWLAAQRSILETAKPDSRPSITQHDEESLLLGFENTVLRKHDPSVAWYSQPGKAKEW